MLKGFFGKKDYGKLVKKKVQGKDGKTHTVYVNPDKDKQKDGRTPREKEVDKRKAWKQKQESLKSRPQDPKELIEKQMEETRKRHLEFERMAAEQRRSGYGRGPAVPKPNTVMRVYAKGKANVGGMLAKVEQVLNDGREVMVQLASGKYYTMPVEQLQFAKSKFAKGRI
ncbi:hypothetical protein CH368_15965 [Leptospira levettii]|nr:hypothetical protein CH368_15965 [Leptospira levettii]